MAHCVVQIALCAVLWCAVVAERPRGPGMEMHIAEGSKPAGNSHRRDGRLLCGQCELKSAHVVSVSPDTAQ